MSYSTYCLCGGCGGLRKVAPPEPRRDITYVQADGDSVRWCRCPGADDGREREIEEFIERLGDVWRKNPNIRLGELVGILPAPWDYRNISDEELLEYLEEFWAR